MKKLLLAAVCFGMFTVANAESDYSPEKGDFAVEFGFTPFQAGGETFKLNEGMLKARWFFTDKNALRLKLGLGIDNNTETKPSSYHPSFTKNQMYYDETTETTNKNTNFSIMLGYERHLFTKGRFDVYAGLELGYIMEKHSGSETYNYSGNTYDNDNKVSQNLQIQRNVDFCNQSSDGKKTSSHSFNANLFAGADFYVWKNLYLGAELGLNFKTGKSPKYYTTGKELRTDIQYNTGYSYTGYTSYTYTYTTTTVKSTTFGEDIDETTTTTTSTQTGYIPSDPTHSYNSKPSTEKTNTSFKFFVEPAIRIGWRF